MRALFTGRRAIFTWSAIGLIVAVVVAVTVVALLPRDRTSGARWGDSTLTVTAFNTDVAVTDAPYEPDAATALASTVPTDYLALRPLDIAANGEVPDSGVTLTLTLTEPLPHAAAATFAYYDEEIATWVPEFTTVSADRLTLTAVVDHLSWWTVLTSPFDEVAEAIGGAVEEVAAGVAEAWDRGAQQLFRFTHEILGNAADYPECSADVPAWVQDLLMSDNADIDLGLGGDPDGNAAVLLCAGSAPGDPDVLEVKAAANRGYGFPVTMTDGVTALSTGPSGVDPSFTSILQFATSYFADTGGLQVIAPEQFVFATQQYAATFDEQTLRAAGVGRILSFDLPDLPQVLVSSGIKAALDDLDSDNAVVAGILTAVSIVRDCEIGALDQSRDAMGVVTWATACAAALDAEEIGAAMTDLATTVDLPDEKLSAQLSAGLDNSGKVVRAVAGKFKLLLIFSIAQTIIDYAGDSLTEGLVTSMPAWYVQTILAPERPTVESLFGSYTDRQPGEFFVRMKIDDAGVDISDCSGCGSVGASLRLVSSTWTGSCYDIVNEMVFDDGETRHTEQESWLLCPQGFGGPGDDSTDRLGQRWQGGEPASWYYRD